MAKDVYMMSREDLIQEIIDAEIGYSWDELEDEVTDSLCNIVLQIRRGDFNQ